MDAASAYAKVVVGRFLAKQAERVRASAGGPVRRAAFLKTHGCATGTLTVAPDLRKDLRVGVFDGDRYDVKVRFASDTAPETSDLENSSVGISIKLLGVPGKKLLDGYEDAATHDFLLMNCDVFPADNVREFMEITEASVGGTIKEYLGVHPAAARIIGEMMVREDSVLWADYNSVTPYRFGADSGRYVKYLLRARRRTGGPAIPAGRRGPNYLAEDLKRRLAKAGTTFDFMIQFSTDPSKMPIDAATVAWDERASPPIRVARLSLPKQTVGDRDAFDSLSFNTWHALPDHEPVGSLNQARRRAYVLSADVRRRLNGEPLGEPE